MDRRPAPAGRRRPVSPVYIDVHVIRRIPASLLQNVLILIPVPSSFLLALWTISLVMAAVPLLVLATLVIHRLLSSRVRQRRNQRRDEMMTRTIVALEASSSALAKAVTRPLGPCGTTSASRTSRGGRWATPSPPLQERPGAAPRYGDRRASPEL